MPFIMGFVDLLLRAIITTGLRGQSNLSREYSSMRVFA